jgi:hypothetical protein
MLKNFILLFTIIVFPNLIQGQALPVNRVKSILSSKIKSDEWLNSITSSSVKYVKSLDNGETIALISIDTLFQRNGSKFVNEEIPYFLIFDSDQSSGIVVWEEAVGRNNFSFLAEIETKNEHFILFYLYSNIGGFIEYYVVDVLTGKWFRSPQFVNNERLDYLSFNTNAKTIYYFLGNTTEKRVGKLELLPH